MLAHLLPAEAPGAAVETEPPTRATPEMEVEATYAHTSQSSIMCLQTECTALQAL